jgi:2-hydroxycyclohexanecarboxyl-CoA dehydrogenase
MNMEGKSAVVTGSASGIGRAIARRFAGLGANVLIVDLNEEGGRETVQLIEKDGGKAAFCVCNVTSIEDARRAVATAKETFGRLDVLVNNAGWEKIEFFINTEPSLWDKIIDINLKGQLNFCKAALEVFIEQGEGGRVVNIASDNGRVGSMGEVIYSACKGGIIAMTKALARESVRNKVLVNCVAPGLTDTPLVAGLDQKMMEAIIKTIPMRRMGEPDEIAEMVAYLASDSNTYITGQVMSVNGGANMVD